MSYQNEYKNLLKDTLLYLENINDKYVVSNSDFFNKELLSLLQKYKSQHIDLPKKRKYSVNIQTFDTTTINKEEPKKTISNNEKKQTVEKNINSKPPVIETSQNNEKIPIKNTKLEHTKKIQRDQKPKIIEDSFADIKKTIEKTFLDISFLKDPIDDRSAKLKSQKYKLKNIASTITILAYKENEKHYRFLEKLAIALDVYFYPSKILSGYLIEKENNLEELLKSDISLIISSDYTIFELPNLRKHYRENPIKGEKYLQNVPLFLLPDISLYLKEPSLKASLFNALKQKIENLKNVK